METILEAIVMSPDVERWIAYATVALVTSSLLAGGLDWSAPRIARLAERMSARARSTSTPADDRAAAFVGVLAALVGQAAIVAAGVADTLRAVLPRARVATGRPSSLSEAMGALESRRGGGS